MTRPAIDLGFLDAEDVDLLEDALCAYTPARSTFIASGAYDAFLSRRATLMAHVAHRLALAAAPEREPAPKLSFFASLSARRAT